MKNQSLLEAGRLHRLGFGIHLLRPRSKIPLESGWTTGPRKSWKEIEAAFRPEYNLGVRLGKASHIPTKGYLAVVDVDIKSAEPRHREEAAAAVARVLGTATRTIPMVLSGRGNLSRHYYCVTAEPFKTFNPFVSAESVDVGGRKSSAWEISLYSEGRQVVLPPSVHPESGRSYRWKRACGGVDDLPLLDFSQLAPAKRERLNSAAAPSGAGKPDDGGAQGFEPVELGLLELSDRIRKGITHGEGVSDRSAFLLPAANALLAAGCTENEVLSVLTDRANFLGQCAYDHAQTASRERAAQWVSRYSLERVKRERETKIALFKAHPIEVDAGEALGVVRTEDTGFYSVGPKGALIPDYDALMKAMEAEYGEFKSIADMRIVFVFNGSRYVDLLEPEIKGYAEKKFNPKPSNLVRNEFNHKILANNLHRRSFFTETTEGKFNFKNGIFDLASETFGPHTPDAGFRGALPYDYDAKAKCPIFKEWLDGVMLGDPELMKILQEYMGYIVRGGDYKFHKALWLEGTGRNGKSTFIDVLKSLIGPSNYSTVSVKQLAGDKFASSVMDGKLANFSEETSPQELSDSGTFKNATGDGELTAQMKFGQIYSYRNRAKFVMTYNTIPDLRDLSPGMISRPLIVPFRKHIEEGEQDHDIREKLAAELPGIFNFALRGWRRLENQNGFTESHLSKKALQTVQESSCNVYQWVEHYLKFRDRQGGEEDFVSVGSLYSAYKRHEPRHAFTLPNFGKRLAAHPKMKERHKKKNTGNGFWGVGFS